MKHLGQHFIDGGWIASHGEGLLNLVNPATEEVFGTITLGDSTDVDLAVAAARRAFAGFSRSTPAERIALFWKIIAAYEKRQDELRAAIAEEIGCPVSATVQITGAIDHFRQAIATLEAYRFESLLGTTVIRREAIGVCGLIAPWNWPIQTPSVKLASALAAGCTVVLKASEYSSNSAVILAQIMADAEVPRGVVNLVLGDGAGVGSALCAHPDVDMISFTGSTRSGVTVALAAAPTVKKVAQELGGKSANIIAPDADLAAAARWSVSRAFFNTGQSCHAPSRILVQEDQVETVAAHLAAAAASIHVGDPLDPSVTMGPVVNRSQFERIQMYIRAGIEDGGRLICGGPGRPEALPRGFYVKPTAFTGVMPDHRIAQDEIFGPVLAVLSYRTEEEAIEIANATPYGLGGYVFSGDPARARFIADRLRAGRVFINGAPGNPASPMGGYKQSGNGREMGVFGLEEYLETKAIFGAAA